MDNHKDNLKIEELDNQKRLQILSEEELENIVGGENIIDGLAVIINQEVDSIDISDFI